MRRPIPVTEMTRVKSAARLATAARASDVLPTPAGPTNMAPAPLRTAASSWPSNGSSGTVTQSTGTAGSYGAPDGPHR